jgi:predicted GNAT superfamily acetyltransferase
MALSHISQVALDAEPDNEISAAAHAALGFSEVGLGRCFRKDLYEDTLP